jgi:hypothetical protein
MTLTPAHAAIVVNDDPVARGQGVIVHLDSGYGGSLSGQRGVIVTACSCIFKFEITVRNSKSVVT